MEGRLENETKIFNRIEEKLNTMPAFVTSWYKYLRGSKKTAATCRDFITKIYHFLEFIDKDVKNVTPDRLSFEIVDEFMTFIQTKTDSSGKRSDTSISYQQSYWSCLNNMFVFMVKRNLITQNYLTLDRPAGSDLERINETRILLTGEDFAKILKATETERSRMLRYRDLAILYLFMITGIREQAMTSINISDIDFENARLVVIDKGNKQHVYDLEENTIAAIQDWIDYRTELFGDEDSDALFISKKHNRIGTTTVYNLVKKYSSIALGYSVSPHKLRSGFCSILYNEVGDAEYVRRVIGHKNITTTQRYIVTKGDERKRAANTMNQVLKQFS